MTVETYGERWLRSRVRMKLAIAGQDRIVLRKHVFPVIGHLLLTELRPHHIRDLVQKLRTSPSEKGGTLAPRTIRRIYGTLHVMLHDAVADELLVANPCVLKRRELPKNIDKDPTWRPTAVFTRAEVETLISSRAISPDRRVLYGVLFLTGMRFGEAAALHWSDLDLTVEPLGRLLVHKSYCFRTKREKPTKTEQPRSVPVHPTLARILKEWWSSGWKEAFGRSPTPQDLILPPCGRLYTLADGRAHRAVTNLSARAHRNINRSLRRLREDLVRVGHSPDRRVHDTRRTFVSLVQAGGARKDILRWVTHGPTGDIMDLYTTLPWPAVCAEVAKLDVRLGPEPEGKESAQAPGQASETLAAVDGLLRSALDLWMQRDANGVRRLLLDILSQMETLRS